MLYPKTFFFFFFKKIIIILVVNKLLHIECACIDSFCFSLKFYYCSLKEFSSSESHRAHWKLFLLSELDFMLVLVNVNFMPVPFEFFALFG